LTKTLDLSKGARTHARFNVSKRRDKTKIKIADKRKDIIKNFWNYNEKLKNLMHRYLCFRADSIGAT
jgi:hypothetical protein